MAPTFCSKVNRAIRREANRKDLIFIGLPLPPPLV
jgi:hypothetical protein